VPSAHAIGRISPLSAEQLGLARVKMASDASADAAGPSLSIAIFEERFTARPTSATWLAPIRERELRRPQLRQSSNIHGTTALGESRERWQALSYTRSLHSTVWAPCTFA
jgi:hypothetical protein